MPRRAATLPAVRRPASPAPTDRPLLKAQSTETADGDEVRLHVDRPLLRNGAAIETVRGPLVIEGWALAPGSVATIEIAVDGRPAATAHHGLRRPDIAASFPDARDAGTSGYRAMLPAAALANGRHGISIELRTGDGAVAAATEFAVEVARAPPEDGPAFLRRKMPLSEVQLGLAVLAGLAWWPRFGLLLGVGEVEEEIEAARRTLASLREQAYSGWRVIVVRRGRTAPEGLAARLVEEFADLAGKIELRLDAPSAAPLAALVAAGAGTQPDFMGILLAGDLLGCDALLEIAIESGLHPEAELFYSDERRAGPEGGPRTAFFKPQWSPDLLTATNYIGRFWCVLTGIVGRSRATVGEWFRFGDYDLVLRCAEAASEIRHIAKVLCERGRTQLDHPDQERAALARAMARRGIAGEICDGAVPGHYRLKRNVATGGLVSIVIPTCAAHGLVETCIETLRARTAYRNFEIVCVENIPSSQQRWKRWLAEHADTVISADGPFNWSRFNNLGARAAKGEFLLFLNDDIEIVEPDWLDALLEHGQRPEIGAVGARLLYPDRTLQHAGIFWTPQGGRHAFRREDEGDPGYFSLALAERNVTAVTGACLLVRRTEFDAQGGFDESHTIVNNDVDFCLRCWERGKRVVYTPHSTLIHHEEASRGRLGEDFDAAGFAARWGRTLQAGDPFHHPYLARGRDDYVADAEPLALVHSAHPLFERDQVRSILAVKLDHIGDFVVAIPALRRLKRLFPQARLHVLTAPASGAFARFLPEAAEFIEFEFFFARSGLGQRRLTAEETAALRRRLEPYRFDLAVDFRKWPETRPLLRLAGARWLAGFDHNRRFPWLDIAVEWEEDPAAVRKHAHIGDDLLRLVDAVGHAAEPNEATLRLPSPAEARRPSDSRRVVIHPGAGTAIKEWPPGYYAELIDRLAAAHDVEIVLIGGRDEAAVAAAVLAAVQRPAAVRSLVGAVPLAELPALLAGAALFVGNDSGPKHIAAALGVPTVGIHSGTVDAREWGPAGPYAVAMQRRMLCSPCYLSDAGQCDRGVACLTELRSNEVYETCRRLLAIDTMPARAGVLRGDGLARSLPP